MLGRAAGLLMSALLLIPSTCQAQTTEFKPVGVRFIPKRTTTVFPGLDDASASSSLLASAARGNAADAVAVEARGGIADDALSDASQRQQAERTGASIHAALRGGNATALAAALAAAGVAYSSPDDQAAGNATSGGFSVNPARAGNKPNPITPTEASVQRTWRALNSFDQVTALGNLVPVTYDPPDQALAVGNGFALAGVNTATRVYRAKTGEPLSQTIDYTVLMGLPPYWGLSSKRPPGAPCGDVVVDPTSLYDPELRRWFQTIARVGLDPVTCKETGEYWIEVAVSKTASPLGEWSVYSVFASSNGQQGSPSLDGCTASDDGGCFSDFPRAQLDPNALVITTNDFAYVDEGEVFVAVSVFVLDKFALAKGAEQVALAEFVLTSAGDWDGNAKIRTVSPSYVPPRKISSSNNNNRKRHPHHHKKKKGGGGGGGPQAWNEPFLLLSHSLNDPYRLIRFALTGLRAVKAAVNQPRLDALLSALTITASPVALPADPPIVAPPAFFRVANQPATGNYPLGQSLNYSPGFVGAGDSRLLSSTVAHGRHLGVFATMTEQEGGLRFYSVYLAQLDAKTGAWMRSDVLNDPGGHLLWPAVALDRLGRGAVVCMASSSGLYLSVAAFPLSSSDGGVGERQLPLEGQGLLDTFTSYSLRPRAGDYSVAVIEAETGLLWGSAEFVAEDSCTLGEWTVGPTCGGTRAKVANWWSGVFAMKL